MLSGDGYDLLRHVFGSSFKEAKEVVDKCLGTASEIRQTSGYKRARQLSGPSTTQGYAINTWARVVRSDEAIRTHPYAQKKGIDWHAGAGRTKASGQIIGQNADCIVVPIREIGSGNVAAVQCINADGAKQTFGPLKGNAFICGNDLDPAGEWFVVEGWADAVSVFRTYSNACVFAAMGLNSLDAVTERVVAQYNPQRLIVVEDAP